MQGQGTTPPHKKSFLEKATDKVSKLFQKTEKQPIPPVTGEEGTVSGFKNQMGTSIGGQRPPEQAVNPTGSSTFTHTTGGTPTTGSTLGTQGQETVTTPTGATGQQTTTTGGGGLQGTLEKIEDKISQVFTGHPATHQGDLQQQPSVTQPTQATTSTSTGMVQQQQIPESVKQQTTGSHGPFGPNVGITGQKTQ